VELSGVHNVEELFYNSMFIMLRNYFIIPHGDKGDYLKNL
jgi:hypothetical protein